MKQLGSRCPDCKTTDAPSLSMERCIGDRWWWCHCVRCGHTGGGCTEATKALAAFYGPQPEFDITPCPVCGKEPELKEICGDFWYRCDSWDCNERHGHSINAEPKSTPAEALAAWEELVRGGR